MTDSRNTKKIKLLRVLQNLVPIFTPVDSLFRNGKRIFSKNDHRHVCICIVAPPRSGSTLTYQLLSTGFQSLYLSNIGNFLYTLPAIGNYLTLTRCKTHISTFNSDRGFVNGLCGEAEGLRFWKYWTNQSLEAMGSEFNYVRAKKLVEIIDLMIPGENIPFITGYLGHVFCMTALRKIFPRIIFVHLKRDLLSNAYSLYQASPEHWYSTKPNGYQKLSGLPRSQQVVKQLILIHKEIIRQSGEDTLLVNYEDICTSPELLLSEVERKCNAMYDVNLVRKNMKYIPIRFNFNLIPEHKDNVSIQIASSLRKEIPFLSSEERKIIIPKGSI